MNKQFKLNKNNGYKILPDTHLDICPISNRLYYILSKKVSGRVPFAYRKWEEMALEIAWHSIFNWNNVSR